MQSRKALIRAFVIMAAIITLMEVVIVAMVEPLLPRNRLLVALVEPLALIVVYLPSMYFLLIRPVNRHLAAKAEAETMRVAQERLRREAEQRLQAVMAERAKVTTHMQFQARILSVVQQAVVATGKGGVILYWNRAAEWMFGWTEEEIQDQTLAKLTGFTAEAARYGLSGLGAIKGWSGEVKAVRRDGSQFPAYLTCSPYFRQDDSVAGFVYTFADISERKNAELQIRESQENLSTVVENSPTGIFIGQGDRLVFANQRFSQILNRPMEALKSLKPSQIIHPDDWPWVQEHWRRRMAGTSAVQDYECRTIMPNGDIHWISGRTTLIRYEGEPSLLGNIQDITEKHQADQALRESRETLMRLSSRLMTAQEMERQRVARELHDSLGQTLSAAKFMVERALEEEQGHEVPSLRTVVPVLQASVEEVRRISMALRPSTLDDLGLLATITWFVREFQATYPHLDVELIIEVEEFEVPDDLKTNIFRIMQEAMNNAAKYSQGTRITLALRLLLGDLQLAIVDNGIGFVMGEGRSNPKGGGFGLVSMRERAELFGGLLIVTSLPGEGTTILARWPLTGEFSA